MITCFNDVVTPLRTYYSMRALKSLRRNALDFVAKGMPFRCALQRSLYTYENKKNGGHPSEAITTADAIMYEIDEV